MPLDLLLKSKVTQSYQLSLESGLKSKSKLLISES